MAAKSVIWDREGGMACWQRVIARDFATAAAQRSRGLASTCALLAALACACNLSAVAQTVPREDDRIPGLPESSIASSLPRELADPGGIRSALGREGITFHVNYISEGLGNPTGGAAERPDDILGIGLAYRGVSSETSAFQKSMGDTIIADFEAMLEVSYTAQIVPGFTIQPDFQYFWNPGGHVPDPVDPAKAVPDAVVLGLRTTINY